MSIGSMNSEYAITHDSEVASVLSHFNRDSVYSIIQNSLRDRIRLNYMPLPNLVLSYEQIFKKCMEDYPQWKSKIQPIRIETYESIMNQICSFYNITFIETVEQDVFSSSVFLYHFLVSNFQSNVISFFTNYISREKSGLYEVLNRNDLKRTKDSSSIYTKKIYTNSKMAIICANLDIVIDTICASDIDFYTFLSCVYQPSERNIIKHIENVIRTTDDFFRVYIAALFLPGSPFRTIMLTDIRLKLQEVTADIDIINTDIIKKDEVQ